MEKLLELLNRQVANFGVLYTKLHNYHWFVSGEKFFELHKKFEELYEEASEYLDVVAERVLQLEGKPVASLKGFLENATIKEACCCELNGREMVQFVVDDFKQIIGEIAETIKVAQELNDEVTVDMLIDISTDLQKQVWMLKTYFK